MATRPRHLIVEASLFVPGQSLPLIQAVSPFPDSSIAVTPPSLPRRKASLAEGGHVGRLLLC